MSSVTGVSQLGQIIAGYDASTKKGEKKLIETLREGLWYHQDLGVVRLDVDAAAKTVTAKSGKKTLGPFPLDGLAASELATKLSELRGQTNMHSVADGYDAFGQEAYPATIGGIQALMRGLERELAEQEQVSQLHREVNTETASTDGKAGFRERYLGGWFGGDGDLSAKLNALEKQKEKIGERASSESADVDALRARIDEAVARHLAAADPNFKKLRFEAAAARELAGASRALVAAIRSAIEECDEAASAKTNDAITDGLSAVMGNNGVVGMMDRVDDFTSNMEVDEAKSALRELKNASETYRTAAERYKNVVGDQSAAAALGRVDVPSADLDFWLDTIFDMDLFGVFSAFSIASDLENTADKLRGEVGRFAEGDLKLGKVSAALTKTERELIDGHREEIAKAPAEPAPEQRRSMHPMLRTHGG